MLKKHPRGLLPAILVNMFTRFAFYTVMSVFIIFLHAKFGFTWEKAGTIYSIFYVSIFVLTLVGGFVADKTRNYKGTILKGLVLMATGYLVIAIPTPLGLSRVFLVLFYIALFLIAFGYGLFKGNIYAMLGQMYDNPVYSRMRDSDFLLSNLFINIGALFAPLVTVWIRNHWITHNGFIYNFDLPGLCYEYIANGKNMNGYEQLEMLASTSGQGAMEMSEFATQYLCVFNVGVSCAFVIAMIAMAISLVIFLRNEKKFPISSKLEMQAHKMDVKLIRQRVYAFLAVFGVLNLFCFASDQEGLTLTYFAKDYTEFRHSGIDFSKINAFFVILVTPIVLAIFGILRAKGKEPSTLNKMAIGMGIAAVAYIIMTIGSIGLPELTTLRRMGGLSDEQLISPYFLIAAFLILATAELFVYPLLNSFVSQYARPKHQGIMQSLCMFASLIGNAVMFLSIMIYEHMPIWATWLIFAGICLISSIIMSSILKWVESTLLSSGRQSIT